MDVHRDILSHLQALHVVHQCMLRIGHIPREVEEDDPAYPILSVLDEDYDTIIAEIWAVMSPTEIKDTLEKLYSWYDTKEDTTILVMCMPAAHHNRGTLDSVKVASHILDEFPDKLITIHDYAQYKPIHPITWKPKMGDVITWAIEHYRDNFSVLHVEQLRINPMDHSLSDVTELVPQEDLMMILGDLGQDQSFLPRISSQEVICVLMSWVEGQILRTTDLNGQYIYRRVVDIPRIYFPSK